MASSLIRLRALDTCWRYPSCVWLNELASATLLEAAVTRPIWETSCTETARPALSSAGETTFEPEDKRARDWLSMPVDCMSSWALFRAARFVLMTITLSMSRPRVGGVAFARRPCRGRVGSGATHRCPRQHFLAAGRLSCDAVFIGQNRR